MSLDVRKNDFIECLQKGEIFVEVHEGFCRGFCEKRAILGWYGNRKVVDSELN